MVGLKKLIIIPLLFIGIITNDLFIEHKCKDDLSLKNIYCKLLEYQILFPDIVLSQVAQETGYLKHVYYNNIFGFMEGNYLKKFNTWEDAIVYKRGWQLRKYKGGDYYNFLIKVGYAEDSLYIQKIKIIQNDILRRM